MSNFIFNNNKNYKESQQLHHIKSDSFKRKGGIVPLLCKSIGFNNGLELETKKTFIGELTKKIEDHLTLDEPAPESLGDLYEIRKKIIFGNLIENDYIIGQFILKTQLNMIEKAKIKPSYFGEKIVDIYNTMICLKETVANYCLVIKLYLIKHNYNKALELFLLMLEKNKKIFEFIYKKIKDTFPKITNSNRIGKFFPLITRKYLEVLSCLVKLSDQINKPKIQNMIIKYYIKTFYIVSTTVRSKFYQKGNENHAELDIKHISKCFYTNIFFDIGIFFFLKYDSFSITIKLLQHILDLYQCNSNNEMMISEKILLLKTYYNLGLFLYVNGQNYESIQNITEAKKILNSINQLPLTKEIKNFSNENIQKDEIFEIEPSSSNRAYHNKNSSNTTIDDIKKDDKNKKNSISTTKSSNIIFGKDINNFQIINDNIEEKIYNEIELLLAEIELSSSNDKNQVIKHINKLLKDKIPLKNEGNTNKFEKEENYCNYKLLDDFERRKIMFLLEKIGNKHKNNSIDRIYKDINNFKTNKHFTPKDMEKFFLFLCNLSDYQLRILNETQPKASILRNNMPIIFTNQFKDLLMNSQRINLTFLETMGLSRYLILKNPNGDICSDNLDYIYMKYNLKGIKNKKNNVDNIKIGMNMTSRNKINNTNNANKLKANKFSEYTEKKEFNNMLNDIKNDTNKDFIDKFRESIINILVNFDEDEKKLIRNSKIFLKDLVKKMNKTMIIHKE